MAEKLLWAAAILLYSLAAVLLFDFHWTFWVALTLATVAAAIGNGLGSADAGVPQGQASPR